MRERVGGKEFNFLAQTFNLPQQRSTIIVLNLIHNFSGILIMLMVLDGIMLYVSISSLCRKCNK